jgi:hypothetical protein
LTLIFLKSIHYTDKLAIILIYQLILFTGIIILGKVGWSMALNATFNNISVISWWLVSLVEEIGVPGGNH